MSEQAPAEQDTPTPDDTPVDGTVTQDQQAEQQNWEAAWAAGLFEGEGCIYLTGNRSGQRYVHLILVSTDKDIVDRFARIVGLGHTYAKSKRLPHHKDQFQWRCARRAEVACVRDLLLPYLGRRRTEKWIAADAAATDPIRRTTAGTKTRPEETHV